MQIVSEFMTAAVGILASLGYPGLFIIMALESSLIPIPSEVVMIPAGYLASQGQLSLWGVLFVSTLGSLAGALFNYYMAYFLGRGFFQKFGKYMGVKMEHMEKVETYFHRHGAISTLIGRLTPVVRQLVSIPAGFARMNVSTMALFTFIGAGVWNAILIAIGYMGGQSLQNSENLLWQITIYVLGGAFILLGAYVVYNKYSKQVEHTVLVEGDLGKVLLSLQKTVLVTDHPSIRSKDLIVTENALGTRVYWRILQKYAFKEGLLVQLLDALCRTDCSAEELRILSSQTGHAKSHMYVLRRVEE